MASLIPGYEYDIFISYRQKDNKHDGWVTEFVDQLKGELESTFKEEVSVYFDINPHDGLLETHEVGDSLKEKLRCLIFIPIISRTYCDPKSFAWEHEFKAFVEQASQDEFGLKIKLPNGNVASRVLPVRIYDLDPADIKLCESVLGGVLRGVEFIYVEPGVNRPLKLNDDDKTNLNKTRYINQINKVANAIKEIVFSLVQNKPEQEEVIREMEKPVFVPRKNNKPAIIAAAGIVFVLILAGIFLIPKLIKPEKEPEKSIAVLPFTNDSPDQENTYFINGLMEEIVLHLQKIKSFDRVASRTSTEQYRGSSRPAISKIGKALNVNYIVTGSGQKYGNFYSLRVQLIRAKDEKVLWAEPYKREIKGTKDIYEIQSQIAQSIAAELKATITPEEKKLIEKAPTNNLIAYNYYLIGREEEGKSPYNAITSLSTIWSDFIPTIKQEEIQSREIAERMYRKAMEYDSTFALAYTGLAGIYWSKNYYKEYFSENFMDSVLILVEKALLFDEELPDAYFIRGMYYSETGFNKQALVEFNKTLKLNPNYWLAYLGKGSLYINEDNYVMAIENLQKADSLHHGPGLSAIKRYTSMALYSTGLNELGKTFFLAAAKLETDSTKYFYGLYSDEGDNQKGYEYLLKGFQLDSTNFRILSGLAGYYSATGQYNKSVKFWQRYLKSIEAQGILMINIAHRIGYVYFMLGQKDTADYYFKKQIGYCKDAIRLHRPYSSPYAYYDLAGIYAFSGNKIKAYENLNILIQKKSKSNWLLNYLETDSLFSSIRNEPVFKQVVLDMKTNTQAEHERVKKWLEEQGML